MVKQDDKLIFTAQAYTNAETVGTVDGTTVFVPQLIVGEKAVVKVNYAKKSVAYADVVELLEPSPKRVNPPCPHFEQCGGCSLMHMDYAEQLVFKHNKVRNNLAKIGGVDFPVEPCVVSPMQLGYRNKLSLPVRGSVGRAKIGMYQKGTHRVVDTDNCLLSHWSKRLVGIFRSFLNKHKIAPYNEQTFRGDVRHLVARFVDGQLLVTVVTNGKPNFNLTPFADALKRDFDDFGLFVNINTQHNNVILGDKTLYICGRRYIEGTHLGVKFRLRPDSFFQVNDAVKDLIYLKVRELLDISRTQVLVDCFSGVGILTNVLASPAYQTFAVEIEPSAVKDADEIAVLNRTPNVTNICGDVAVELPRLCNDHRDKVKTLVVDPPRKGLGPAVCKTVVDAAFDNIVYVSCDSATLARDLAALSQAYAVDFVQPYDMFPQTAEVETVVHLKRK